MNYRKLLLAVIFLPLVLVWSANVDALNDYGGRDFKYWNYSLLSIIGMFLFCLYNLELIIRSSKNSKFLTILLKGLGLLFSCGLLSTLINSDFNDLSFYEFLKNIILYTTVILGLLVGSFIRNNAVLIQQMKYYALIAAIFSMYFFFFEFASEDIYYILSERPYTLSFYFIPFFTFYLLNSNLKYPVLISLIVWLSFLVVLSGSRSGSLLQLGLVFGHLFKFGFKRNMFFVMLGILVLFFFDLSWFEAARIHRMDSPRGVIWESALNQIRQKNNFIFGNGFIRTTFEADGEKVSTAHNSYIQLFYSFGVIGVVIGSYLIYRLVALITTENIFFALAILIMTFINDFSLFPIDFSRLYEYSFVSLFFGFYISKIENSNT
jgi:hypothetical protein